MNHFKGRRFFLAWIASLVVGGGLGNLYLLAKASREQSKQAECKKNVRVLSLGLINYRDSRGEFPPPTIVVESLPPTKRWSWFVTLWDWIDGNPPHVPEPELPWDDRRNQSLAYFNKDTGKTSYYKDQFNVFLCPNSNTRHDSNQCGLTTYVGVAGLGKDAPSLPAESPRAGIFGYRGATTVDQIKNGLATTLMIIETSSKNGSWRAAGFPTTRSLNPESQPYIGKQNQFGGLHHGGAIAAFADGSVRFIRNNVNPRVFEAMATIAGGEEMQPDPNVETP